jgi:ABC-2 type transport system ATP-binding protein
VSRSAAPDASPGELLVEAHGVSYAYSSTFVVEDVDLTVRRGEFVALVGPNGSGKSTLIRGWIGFEPPTEGRLSIAGIDPQRQRKAAVMRSGYVPQQPALYRELTIAEHIELAITFRVGFDADLARTYVERLGIPLAAQANQLSGGEQAQVGLALALGTRARILLLDEPLASLDPLARREFLNVLVTAVRGEGHTALLSSHVITDIEQACDRLVVLGRGRTLLDLSVDDALAHHRVVEAASWKPGRPGTVGTFPTTTDERLTLVRVGPNGEGPVADGAIGQTTGLLGRSATLEEVVIGHLAAGRRRGQLEADEPIPGVAS